jgi:hypothetical protein
VEDGTFMPFEVFLEERNNRRFEEHERILEKIKSLFFDILYLWKIAFVSSLMINFLEFLVLFDSTR